MIVDSFLIYILVSLAMIGFYLFLMGRWIMDNLEYLKNVRDKCFRDKNEIETRKVLALEIIAEELCIMNNPKYKVTIVKPKIKIHKKSLNEYMRKTSI